jgi:lipopolysaccharide transport system ATP-binding protein
VQEYLRDISRANTTPLHERTDRSGSGEVQFVSVLQEAQNGSNIAAFRCGTEAVLHLIIENKTQAELRGLRISLGIDNELGERVALLDTMLVGDDISGLAPGRQSVRVVIPKMPLIPGRYRLTLLSIVNKVIADWIENAVTIAVESGDFYGTGQLMLNEQGMFLFDHYFVVERSAGGQLKAGFSKSKSNA